MDKVEEIYIGMVESRLIEMTEILRQAVSMMTPENAKVYAEKAVKLSKVNRLSQETTVHSTSNMMNHITVHKGAAVHSANFGSYEPNQNVPFIHHVQSFVDSVKDGAPKGTARIVMHMHLNHHNVPLVSDEKQTPAGHEMWKKFARESLDRGNHVYFLNEGKLNKSTAENLDSHLKSYYGDGTGFGKRMVVSKSPINLDA